MAKRSRFMVLLLVGLMFFALGQPVFALETESREFMPQTYNFLAITECYFSDSGNGLVSVSGKTTTYTAVDNITTTVYLQKRTSSGWADVKSWRNSTNNKSSCSAGGTTTVAKGCEYRDYCYHKAAEGNSTETDTSSTNGYWVE